MGRGPRVSPSRKARPSTRRTPTSSAWRGSRRSRKRVDGGWAAAGCRRGPNSPSSCSEAERSALPVALAPVRTVAFTASVRGFTALSPGLRGQRTVLREAALLAGNARPALAGDLALTLGVHGREAALRGSATLVALPLRHLR